MRVDDRHPFMREPISWRAAAKALVGSAIAIGIAFAILLWAGANYLHHVAVPVP